METPRHDGSAKKVSVIIRMRMVSLWTAACCTYEHKDDRGNLLHEIINTAFGRINDPGDSPCEKRNISVLSQYLSENIKGIVDLFPNSPQCYSKKNYIPLQC